MFKFKEKNIYLYIFLLALFVRIIYVLYNYNLPLEINSDESAYNALAKLIATEGKYYREVETYSRPPAYPLFMGIIYFLFGHNLIFLRIAQAIIDSLLCMFIYKLCYKLFNNSVALVASLMATFYFIFIHSITRILTESLFTFILFLAIFYIYKIKEKLSYKNMFILGICFAALALTKGITLLFMPFAASLLLLTHFYHPMPLRDVTRKFIFAFIAFLLPLSIWMYRNYIVYRAFIPVSTQTGYALYDSYFPRNGKVFGVSIVDDNVRYAVSLKSQVKMSRFLAAKTLEFIRHNPLKVLKLELLKVLYFWVPFDWEIMRVGKGLYHFQYVFILPFSVFGIFLLMRRHPVYLPLYIPIAYLFLMSLAFYGSPRFRMPIEPFLIIFFAVGMLKFFKLFKNKYIPLSIGTSYAFINFFLYLNSDLLKHICRNVLTSVGVW